MLTLQEKAGTPRWRGARSVRDDGRASSNLEVVSTVIIPAYNELTAVARVVESLKGDVDANSYHLILIAKGRCDATTDVARQAWPCVDDRELC